jgi:hypothetical protein
MILSASDDGTVTLGQCDECGLSAKELTERTRELATAGVTQCQLNDIHSTINQIGFWKWIQSQVWRSELVPGNRTGC